MSRKAEYVLLEERYKLYRLEHTGEYYKCIYCGDPADTVDHVPPLSRAHDYETLNLANTRYIKVHCCRECNGIAGASLQESIIQRVEYVKDRLARVHRSDFMASEWDEEEIDELGPTMKAHLKAAVAGLK